MFRSRLTPRAAIPAKIRACVNGLVCQPPVSQPVWRQAFPPSRLRKECYRTDTGRRRKGASEFFSLSSRGRMVEPRESGKPGFGFALFLGVSELLRCANRSAISKGGRKGEKPDLGSPGFPQAVISAALVLSPQRRDRYLRQLPMRGDGQSRLATASLGAEGLSTVHP